MRNVTITLFLRVSRSAKTLREKLTRQLRLAVLLSLATTWWSGLWAQGFDNRYDPLIAGSAHNAWCVEPDGAGGYVVIGNMPWLDSLYYSSKVITMHLDAVGDQIGAIRFDTPLRSGYPGWSNSSIKLGDGRISLCGGTQDASDTNRVALYWFDAIGSPLNKIEILPGSYSWIAYQHKNTPDGGFIVTGVTSMTGLQDVFLMKTDSLGGVQWWQTYGHPTRLDYSSSVDHAPNGGYYVAGKYPTGSNDDDQWVIRTDSLGNLIWSNTYGTPLDDQPSAHLTTLADGNCVFGSGWRTATAQNHQFCLVKIDNAGNVMWQNTYDEDAFDETFFVVQEVTPGGDLIACGQRGFNNGMGGGDYKGTLLRTNSQGDSLWMRHYFSQDSLISDGEGSFRDVQPTPDGGFIAVGYALGSASGNNPPSWSSDIWVVKVDSLGCIQPGCHIVTGIESIATNLTEALTVYPNPASGSTTAKVELPKPLHNSKLRLVLVSAQGQLVREMALPPLLGRGVGGEASYSLSLTGLAAGLYYLHLANEDTWLSGIKLIVE